MSRPPPLPIYTLKGNMAAVSSVDLFSLNILCTGTIDGDVHLWDLTTKREKLKFKVGRESCLSVSNVHGHLLTQEKGGIVHLWSMENGGFTEEANIKCPYVGFCKCEQSWASSCQEGLIFAPGEDSAVNIISLKNKSVVTVLQSQSEKLGEIMSMKYFDMEGTSYLLTAYESGHIYLWNLKTRKYLSEMKLDGTPMDLDFDPQKKMGICGTESNVFSVFKLDINTGSLNVHKSIEITNAGISRTCIRPDGKFVALGCWDGRIRLYSWKTLKLLAVLPEHKETVQDICFSREAIPSLGCECLMVAGAKDQRVSLWDIYND